MYFGLTRWFAFEKVNIMTISIRCEAKLCNFAFIRHKKIKINESRNKKPRT